MVPLRTTVLLGLVQLGAGLYFHINEGETKCFIEEVPDETMVVGKYATFTKSDSGRFDKGGVGIHVNVADATGDEVMDKDFAESGRFAFNTHEPGEHTICMHTNSSRWFGGQEVRVHLDIRIGEASNDYDKIQKKERLSQVETRLYQLLAQARQISNEQAYQRTREATFREISESTNVRVLWWSIGQALILVLVGYLQYRHLKDFFEQKKLV